MRALLFPLAVLAFGAPVPALAQGEMKFDPKRVGVLIGQLGDPDFKTRQAAEKELIGIGEPVLPQVRKAVEETSVQEVAERGERVIRAILQAARTSKTTGLELALLEPDKFQMGSPGNEPGRRADEKQRAVQLTRQFLVGKYEVTQAEYQKVMEVNPSHFAAAGGGKDKVKDIKTERFPVEQVSWFDAVEFCNRLSKADGHPAYYALSEVKKDGDAITAAAVKVVGGTGYRLPTEAEWEFAARGGTTTAFSFGPRPFDKAGNFKMIVTVGYGGSEERGGLGRTGVVGGYKANKVGLYDAHGNAAEWCHDWYAKDYPDPSPDDPTGPDKGDHRVVRGGSWMVSDSNCRSAARFYLAPSERKDYVGFRVARTP